MRTEPLSAIAWDRTEDSSNVECLFFDEPTNTVCVRFKGGGLYSYAGPTHEIYMNLRMSASIGRYLHNVIKAYPYTRWESEDGLLSHLNTI